jgi:hypothetical protein
VGCGSAKILGGECRLSNFGIGSTGALPWAV